MVAIAGRQARLWQCADVRSFTAVVNPLAGGDVAGALGPVAAALRSAGAAVTTEYSRSMSHAQELARVAVGRGDVVIAVGGDGLVGGIANVVVAGEGVLGIVPAGRGNDFARQLGLPGDPGGRARLLLEAEAASIDVIEAAGKIVLGSVYAGIDSVANAIANRSHRIPHRFVYQVAALRAIVTWRPVRFDVDVDGEQKRFRGYNVVVANAGYYGNGLHIAPNAAVDDGLLDIVMMENMPRRRFATVMREVAAGTHVHRPEVTVLRGRQVRIAADRQVPAYGDGEALRKLPVVARVRPGGLRLLRPHSVAPTDGS